MSTACPFDGLAEDYDRERPRYPRFAFEWISSECDLGSAATVVDVGAGTGIVLEGLLPLLPADCRVVGIDYSHDMIQVGTRKFPNLEWIQGEAEALLSTLSPVDLITAGQSYQWLDRERFLTEAYAALSTHGGLAIMQNNRDYHSGGFADAYETLLETWSPGYQRDYRKIDIQAELLTTFPTANLKQFHWSQKKTPEQFMGMSASSTQSQAALHTHGAEYTAALEAPTAEWSDADGQLTIPYVTEVYLGQK
ncbi:trans-aconitate 2-methyltransferase [Corynebacterium atrinae]|uniref:class I SAM-dependent methyltransferase n=1 Tax=Corynebacterium atrinae TaxID=1336740 RepID=UPI0025B56E06|nr:class I SAM-dependent methyltransferase [Corynebacterium atrinae]WJY62737.1 trans-aconitate 2-methyltransferase [Corynebacterium atrinae]